MATINIDAEKRAYKKFIAAGMTPAGACGLIGNLEAESDGFYTNRVEYLCIRRLQENGKTYTDKTYTAAVDEGKISAEEFLHPLPGKQYGYGLAQWTSPGRKSGLWNLAKRKGVSIADEDMQYEFLLSELEDSYPSVLNVLKTAKDVKTASDTVLTKFEIPADTGTAVRNSRSGRGQKFYDDYVKKENDKTGGAKPTPQTGGKTMTESQLRQKVVGIMQGWVGKKESDGSHRSIIDIYNGHKPLARGYAVKYTDAWCATCVSAAAIKAELTDIIPTECGCGKMIELFANLGEWQENDAYVPAPGDVIFYDWDDSGSGDNRGSADHVGIVEKVAGSTITVIEGNKSNAVGRRNLQVNGRYIRGYGVPKYSKKATAAEPKKDTAAPATGSFNIGDTVSFTGNAQYTSSYSGGAKKAARACKAKITALSKGKPHPYHIIGDGVYGWVDAKDIGAGSTTINVGDTVQFVGTKHYVSSYAGAKAYTCKGGEATVQKIVRNNPHPYLLHHTGKGCTVEGWVDAKDVTK